MKIVVGVDGSQHSLAAVKFAGRLLDAAHDTILLYYSVPAHELETASPESTELYARARGAFAQAIFEAAQEALPAGLQERCVLVHDQQTPYKGLLATAKAHEADLIAVGARGAGPIKRLLLGSVSHAVAQAREFPTLVVRNPPTTSADRALRVLVACPGAETGTAIANLFAKIAWPPGSEAHVIHVIESMFAGDVPDWVVQKARSSEVELEAKGWRLQHEQDKKQAEESLRQYCQALPKTLANTHVHVAEGNPTHEILEYLETGEFDLTVVGSQGRSRVMRFLLGSTSEHVLAHAPNSVLIVP